MELVATNSGIDTDAAAAAVPARCFRPELSAGRGEVRNRGDFGGWKQSTRTIMALRHPNLSIEDLIWLLNHDSIIPREVLGGVGDLL
jgi:hypothetical protein